MSAAVPVTLVSGFLGAGKTTLVNHVLRSAQGLRVGVLVNDFGALGIDAALISGTAGDVVSLTNGCVCCTIKSDVVASLLQMLEKQPEHVLIETSGISNPGAVVETIAELEHSGAIRLDGVVAVVDAETFDPSDKDRGLLTRCQVLAADLVVLNKIDLVSDPAEIRARIRVLKPEARIIEATNAEIPLDVLIGHPHANKPHDHTHPEANHGFRSMTFTADQPIAFRALAAAIQALPPNVFRVKGFVDAIERPGQKVIVHRVGERLFVRSEPGWTAPRTELVLIGANLDEAQIRRDILAAVER